MFNPATRLEPNTIEIAAKVLDGEAILINLSTGIYYSMDKVGAAIWTLINDGYSMGDIANAVTARYTVDKEQAQNDLQQVVEALVQEKIVTPITTDNDQTRPLPEFSGTKEAYETPKLNIYQDMGDLLALDPPMPGLADLTEFKEEK